MSNDNEIAQLQDRMYSIGGGSRFINNFGIDDAEVVFPSTPPIIPPIVLPWYRRWWIFMNTDIFELWRRWRNRR